MELLATDKDFTTSLEKALDETDYNWRDYKGLIIAGTHTPENIDEKIEKIKEARREHIPFLGICFGFQLMAIEYARNALGKWKANSTEIDLDTNFPIVVKTNALRVGMKPTMDLWGNQQMESFWHNYKLNNEYLSEFVKEWKFTQVYDSDLGESIVDYLFYRPALDYGSIFMGTQFHWEYQSSIKKPHWVAVEFLKVCREYTKKHVWREKP